MRIPCTGQEVALSATNRAVSREAMQCREQHRAAEASHEANATMGRRHLANVTRTEEEATVHLLKLGDHRAFEQLSAKYHPQLFRTTLRITKNPQDAEDAVQATLLQAFTHAASFNGRSAFSTWLTAIARNSALQILRKRKCQCEISMEPRSSGEENWSLTPISDEWSSPDRLYEYRETEERLHRAILRLRPTLQCVIRLYYVNELCLDDIASQLSISVAAVKSRLLRARRFVRSHAKLFSPSR